MYQTGDILFFTALNGNLLDSFIQTWTSSRFVHTAIAISPTHLITALGIGVQMSTITPEAVAASWSYQQNVLPVDTARLQKAIVWLQSQVGQVYGWGDIVNAALSKVETTVSVDIGHHFDCSALACEFLLKAGGVSALDIITDAHEITPGMLAKLLGVV